MTATLRERLEEIGETRRRLRRETDENRDELISLLHQVRESEGITITEAAELVGIGRLRAHELLRAAARR